MATDTPFPPLPSQHLDWGWAMPPPLPLVLDQGHPPLPAGLGWGWNKSCSPMQLDWGQVVPHPPLSVWMGPTLSTESGPPAGSGLWIDWVLLIQPTDQKG